MKELKKSVEVIKKWEEIVNQKFKIFEEVDIFYRSQYGVDKIIFFEEDDNTVSIFCDNSYRGDYDMINHDIPIDWFLLSDDDLRTLLEKNKIEREESERIKKIKEEEKEERIKEAKELALFEELKKKFEIN